MPKPLVRVRGITLLRRALMLGASLSPHRIFAVVPRQSASYRHQAAGIPVSFIANSKRAEGLATSVRIGIRHARFAAAILILPVDLYALQRRDLVRLLAHWSAMPGRCTATRIGAHGGIPLILPARGFLAAAQLQGDSGLRHFLARFTPSPLLVKVPAAQFDIDTPQELQAARLHWSHAGGDDLHLVPKRKIAENP